jgi:acyl-CoA synthetase (AMP-forming)/AMP-acid ligase II
MSGATDTLDPIFAAVTAQGSPFEIGDVDGVRVFCNAPADLNQLVAGAERFAEREAVVDFEGDDGERRFTFADIFGWRDRLAAALPIQRGDRVAICMRNRAEWMVAFLGVVRAGGIAALLNSRSSADEMLGMIDDVTPAVVIADAERAQMLRDSGYTGQIIDAAAMATLGEAPVPPMVAAKPTDACAILFTSGTTGRAKGAVLSHRSLITGLLCAQLTGAMVMHGMAKQYGVSVETIAANAPIPSSLLVYPLFHISGLGSGFLAPLISGGKSVIMRRWDASDAVKLIEKEGVTQLASVPTMLWDMVHGAKAHQADLSSLRNIGCGGQALPSNLLAEVETLCPQAMIGVGYGMTETSGSIAQAVGADFLRERGSAGRILPLVDLKIEAADGSPAAIGESGEILVRSAMVMSGYWGKPKDSADMMTEDGWLRTGDIGYQTEEGYLFIVDRAKDMVISGGENIYCAEVERALNEMPQITECATFGVADERLGERLVAVVQADGLDEQAVVQWVSERLARYKAPSQVAFITDPLPRNAVHKVDKRILRAMWSNLVRSS